MKSLSPKTFSSSFVSRQSRAFRGGFDGVDGPRDPYPSRRLSRRRIVSVSSRRLHLVAILRRRAGHSARRRGDEPVRIARRRVAVFRFPRLDVFRRSATPSRRRRRPSSVFPLRSSPRRGQRRLASSRAMRPTRRTRARRLLDRRTSRGAPVGSCSAPPARIRRRPTAIQSERRRGTRRRPRLGRDPTCASREGRSPLASARGRTRRRRSRRAARRRSGRGQNVRGER